MRRSERTQHDVEHLIIKETAEQLRCDVQDIGAHLARVVFERDAFLATLAACKQAVEPVIPNDADKPMNVAERVAAACMQLADLRLQNAQLSRQLAETKAHGEARSALVAASSSENCFGDSIIGASGSRTTQAAGASTADSAIEPEDTELQDPGSVDPGLVDPGLEGCADEVFEFGGLADAGYFRPDLDDSWYGCAELDEAEANWDGAMLAQAIDLIQGLVEALGATRTLFSKTAEDRAKTLAEGGRLLDQAQAWCERNTTAPLNA